MLTASRYHDISCGHRVVGHEGKCQLIHGHNYRVHFHCTADGLDGVGRVVDFSVIKAGLCMWLEENWDHKLLLWNQDPLAECAEWGSDLAAEMVRDSMVCVPFNPTAEQMARYLVKVVGPQVLGGTGVTLQRVTVEETRKCAASADARD